MLPEGLSNELCSLKPNVDRLTKCAEFLLSPEGRVLKTIFYSAVINSQRRFSYQEAFAVLGRRPANPIEQMLHDGNRLAQTIRRARMAAGSLNLDFPENKIRLDEQGRVLRIERVENDISHQLIEEFMLLANEAAARRLQQINRPAIYRVHEPPDADRLEEFREDVISHRIACGDLKHRPEVQKLLQRFDRLPIGEALKIGFLKSLMRARYAIESLGHYGLAKVNYTHFTSPIRRYSDLVVHRALFHPAERSAASTGKAIHHQRPAAVGSVSSPGNLPDRKAVSQPLKQLAEHLSDTERNSSEAEQDSKNIKLFAYLAAQLKAQKPERYPALVSDVRNFGFFVDVPTLGMRGLVPLSLMKDEFYQFDATRGQLVGRRSRRVIKLGDKVEVQVAKVDTFKKQVDYRLADSKEAPRHRPGAHRGRMRT
jgi:ribonuclease R